MDPEKRITEELARVEEEHGVTVVNARERGSRMTGVSHADSDWDVLFLFSQPAENYATIHGRIDSIHEPHCGKVDLHGWNVDKFGDLVSDSNPDAIAYCRRNATEYVSAHDNGEFERLAINARNEFNHMALYHHYLSMAKRNWSKYVDSGNEPTKNRQFHVIRPIAMAQHLRITGGLPPFDVDQLLSIGAINEPVYECLARLAYEKRNGNNDDVIPDAVGHLYKAESEAPMEPTDERIKSPDTELIDEFIRSALP